MTYRPHLMTHGPRAGRWCVAAWDERSAQWRSPDIDAPGVLYGYARTRPEDIRAMRHYAHRFSAYRALRRIMG